MAHARIGCSGWQYRDWRGRFYPKDLAQDDWLEYYASRFETVEVNNTFYRLPDARVFESWAKRVPAGFVVAVKASRYLTHLTRLQAAGQPLRRLFSRVTALGDRLGPILYQLPATLEIDVPRLQSFLCSVDSAARRLRRRRRHQRHLLRHVIEFRHPSWYVDDVFDLLASHGVALCLHDRVGSMTPRLVVGQFAYIRFHGSSGRYQGGYDADVLDEWAEWIREQVSSGIDVYGYFNNDSGGMAVRDALTLERLFHRRSRSRLPASHLHDGHEHDDDSALVAGH